jgi:hypothetical protein
LEHADLGTQVTVDLIGCGGERLGVGVEQSPTLARGTPASARVRIRMSRTTAAAS